MFPAWNKFNNVRFQVLIAKMLQNICNIYQSTKCNISDNLNTVLNNAGSMKNITLHKTPSFPHHRKLSVVGDILEVLCTNPAIT
jgi:hypothetical protein